MGGVKEEPDCALDVVAEIRMSCSLLVGGIYAYKLSIGYGG
jgi:hypothetical protein